VYDNFLLFVDGPQGKLFQMALNGTTVLELPVSSPPQNPVAVDFDPLTQTVYWTDIESRTVRRAAINGSNQEIFLQLQPGACCCELVNPACTYGFMFDFIFIYFFVCCVLLFCSFILSYCVVYYCYTLLYHNTLTLYVCVCHTQ